MRASTKKLTTAAVCTAIAVIMCACTAYLPFSFMPLYIAAFSIFLACKRGSLVYGILSALASVGIMFAMTGLSVSWFLLLFMFAPYGIMTYFLHKLTYFKLKSGLLRGVIAAAFFNLATGLTYLVATGVVQDIPVTDWVNALGGYWVLAIVATLVLVPLDFIFSALGAVVLKKIPPADRKKPIKRIEKKPSDGESDNAAACDSAEEISDGRPRYDIFGYEITDEEPDEGSDASKKSDNKDPDK